MKLAVAQTSNSKKKFLIGTESLKGIITMSIILLSLVVFLACDVISKNHLGYGTSISFKGFDLIQLMFNGGEYMDYVRLPEIDYVDYFKITYPMFITYVALACSLLLIFALALQVLRYTVFSDKKIISKVSGWFSLSVGLVFLIVYVYLMFSKVEVFTMFDETPTEYYRVFETKPTILIISILMAFSGIIELKLNKKVIPIVKRFLPIYAFMIVPLILIAVFNLYPIVLQTILSFKEFVIEDGIWGSEWVGFAQFTRIFSDSTMLKVIGRTVYISFLRLIVGIVPPLVLSICLYDLKSGKARSIFQNIVYIPHFFSWVVVYAICYALLSPEGLINTIASSRTDFMVSSKYFMPIVIISAIWKELGWGTILYLAALSGVDVALFEAAKIDGATPLKRIWYITLPCIKNTIIFLTIMSLGNILKGAGGEQLLLFYSATTRDQALVIDTWLIWFGMNELEYSLGAAMSFFQSLIGMIMVLGFNWISKKTTDVSIW